MKKNRAFFLFIVLLLTLGLVTISVVMADSGSSFSRNANPVSGPSNQSPAVAAGGSITITHSASQAITALNSVSCNAGGLHSDNSYYRVFDLSTFGIAGQFDVTAVQYGIEQATAGAATQPVQVNLYTLNGTFTLANLTPIGSTTDNISDQSGTIFTSLVSGSVPANGVLVVEVFTPDGQTAGHSFFIGSNAAGQTGPSYLRAADCGVTQPTATGTIGFPNMHIVMNVIGNEVGGQSSITMTKTVGTDATSCAAGSSITVPYGSTVYYCYSVENTGNITLTTHTVVDDVLGTVLGPDAAYALAPGATFSFTSTHATVTETVTAGALWTASVAGSSVATATGSTTVTVQPPTDVALTGFAGQANGSMTLVVMVVLTAVVAGAALLVRRFVLR